MIVQSVCFAPSAEELSRPKCPRCGGILLVAENSRFSAEGRIDHAWACDDCGNEFATSVRLWVR